MQTPLPDEGARHSPAAMRAHGVARPLFGAEKVAALLLSMDRPIAGRLLKRFDRSNCGR